MALSRGPIPPDYFDAVTATEAESIRLEADVNGRRYDAQIKTKLRR